MYDARNTCYKCKRFGHHVKDFHFKERANEFNQNKPVMKRPNSGNRKEASCQTSSEQKSLGDGITINYYIKRLVKRS